MSCSEFFTKFPDLYDVLICKLESVLKPYSAMIKSPLKPKDDSVAGFDHCVLTSADMFSTSEFAATNAVLYPVLLLLERLYVTENEEKYAPFLTLTLK